MDLQLKGLRAVVSGGTKGIGRAIAETLAREGADVAICARNDDEVKATAAALAKKGVRSLGHAVDVGDGKALKAWVEAVVAAFGGIDIVIANVSALAISGDEEGWRRGFEVDLMHSVRLVNAAMPWLEKSRTGSIVTISSVSGREIDFAAGPYGAFKAALMGALLYLGDCHATQGDGELCGVAVEQAATVAARVELIKGWSFAWPRLETESFIMTIGSARPLEDAARIAYRELIRWMVADYGFEELDAYLFLTQAGRIRLGNMVDPKYTVGASVLKKYVGG